MSTKKENRKGGVNLVIFAVVTGLTLYTVLKGQDLHQIGKALKELSAPCLILSIFLAVFFVCAEGIMIWYLLRSVNGGKSGLMKCISYSFIGFFYSGITPSATGGQPMQLYYMKKDGNTLSDSSVVLMTVAIIYKFVLAVLGIVMMIFWFAPLLRYLRGYFGLYILGLALNVFLVVILLTVMAAPEGMKKIICKIERVLVRMKVFKESEERKMKIEQFIGGYREAVRFLACHKGKVCLVIAITFLQRVSVFVLTALIYYGFSQKGTGPLTVMFLQAAVIIAVDMLPLPGAQGITELMYCSVFRGIFADNCLMPSLYVTRGINFYFLLIVSLLVVIGNQLYRKGRC